MKKNIDFKNKQNGISILGVLVFGIILILILSYFNIKSVAESPTGQENINYIKEGTKDFWVTYLAKPASYMWNEVWLPIVWNPLLSNLK